MNRFKRVRIKVLLISAYILGFVLAHAYAYGIIMDKEYPYWWTLYQAAHAPFRNGVPAQIVAEELFPNEKLHWHTCNYCVRYAPENCSHVKLTVTANDGSVRSYPFIFDHKTGRLRTHPDGVFVKSPF